MLRHVSSCDRLSSGKSSIYDTELLLAILTYVSCPTGQNANYRKFATMAYPFNTYPCQATAAQNRDFYSKANRTPVRETPMSYIKIMVNTHAL